MFVLFAFTNLIVATSFTLSVPTKSTPLYMSAATEPTAAACSDNTCAALKKISQTLAVCVEVAPSDESAMTESDLTALSMNLRKIKASALFTESIDICTSLQKEQQTAKGNFPGPCPVIYNGPDPQGAIEKGAEAIVLMAGSSIPDVPGVMNEIDVLWQINTDQDVAAAVEMGGNVFLVDADNEQTEAVVAAIPEESVIVAAMDAMQEDNEELERGKTLKSLGVTSILLRKACIGDNEDLEYSTFAIDGLTKKKSSTFNMSGLTGSTNGHFGGVASSSSANWMRHLQRES